jgi:hypothetical protein
VSDFSDDGLTRKVETCSSLEKKYIIKKCVALEGQYDTLVYLLGFTGLTTDPT